MIPLPMVGRELRAASRRKSTHRIRLYTTLVASSISVIFMLAYAVSDQLMLGLGRAWFMLLAYYAFGLSLMAGIFFTADCISEEKREGTLGLLFLTDLRGVDVVMGKLVSCGLATLYGLVAVMPMLALPLLMGGTTGGQFWRTALALTNNLFFALAGGILISTISKQAHRAMLGTIGLLVVTVICLSAAGSILSRLSFPFPFWYLSPLSALNLGVFSSYGAVAGQFWPALLASHLGAWIMIGLASWLVPRLWQEKSFGRLPRALAAFPKDNAAYAKPASQGKRRRILGEANPIQWLMERSGNLRLPAWLLAVIFSVFALMMVFLVLPRISLPGRAGVRSALPFMRFGLVSAFGWLTALLVWLFKILFAFQSCKFFAEARRSGALEIMVSTPLSVRDFIQGQWGGLKRNFLWPLGIFMAAQLIFSLATIYFMRRNIIAPQLLASGVKLPFWIPIIFTSTGMFAWQVAVQMYALAHWVTNLLAIGWVGMWFALSFQKPNLAPALTILFVVLLPNVVFCLPGVIPDLIFIFWARRQLRENFRRYAFPQQWSYAGVAGLAAAPLPRVV